jgi:hypothetical protein
MLSGYIRISNKLISIQQLCYSMALHLTLPYPIMNQRELLANDNKYGALPQVALDSPSLDSLQPVRQSVHST